MATYIIKQGEDKKIVISVKDSSGAPINVTTASEIRAVIFVGNTKLESYSLSDPDYGKVELTPEGPTNEVNIFVDRGHTRLWPTGALRVALIVSLPDADFPDATKDSEYDFLVGRVVEGLGKDESL